jgi:DNA-binding transcriptional LysR family regulator
MDLDLRKLRYFVAVAESLHFGRAAAALYISQPALSRQIRQLENEIGTPLFVRTSRTVTLTAAGEQLARDAARLLAASRAALDSARRAASPDRTLTVGFMLGTDIDLTLRAFTERYPDVDVQLTRLRWWNHAQAVLDGSVDVAFVRLPISSDGLVLRPLYTEPLCVTLPVDHPLAGEAAVDIADIADEPVLLYADATPAWSAFWTVDPRPDGSEPRHGPVIHDMEEIVGYVRAWRGVAFLPAPIAAAFPGRDTIFVPMTGTPPGQVALAWCKTRQSPLTAALAEAAEGVFSRRGRPEHSDRGTTVE